MEKNVSCSLNSLWDKKPTKRELKTIEKFLIGIYKFEMEGAERCKKIYKYEIDECKIEVVPYLYHRGFNVMTMVIGTVDIIEGKTKKKGEIKNV